MSENIKNNQFKEFLASKDTIRIYRNGSMVFSSNKERLLPLIEYMDRFISHKDSVLVLDRVVGNAAALLFTRINCKEVFSDLGSENAIKTLDAFGIKYSFNRMVPCIENENRSDMCPMEKLSLGKSPEEFYTALKQRIKGN
jgi:hypothetical protein